MCSHCVLVCLCVSGCGCGCGCGVFTSEWCVFRDGVCWTVCALCACEISTCKNVKQLILTVVNGADLLQHSMHLHQHTYSYYTPPPPTHHRLRVSPSWRTSTTFSAVGMCPTSTPWRTWTESTTTCALWCWMKGCSPPRPTSSQRTPRECDQTCTWSYA